MIELTQYNFDGSILKTHESLLVSNIDQGKNSTLKKVVLAYQASKRSGNHKTKQRSEVSYSTKKLYKQKGTGNARAGSAKSPLRRHGGTVFGPLKRDYSQKINKKEKLSALLTSLSLAAEQQKIKLVDDFKIGKPKCNEFKSIFSGLDISSALIVLPEIDDFLEKATRNFKFIKLTVEKNLTTYDVLKFKNIYLTISSAKKLKLI